MLHNSIIEKINTLNNGDKVSVKLVWHHPIFNKLNETTGTVHKGITNCGKDYFYIRPDGDNHPGASISKGDIISITNLS